MQYKNYFQKIQQPDAIQCFFYIFIINEDFFRIFEFSDGTAHKTAERLFAFVPEFAYIFIREPPRHGAPA